MMEGRGGDLAIQLVAMDSSPTCSHWVSSILLEHEASSIFGLMECIDNRTPAVSAEIVIVEITLRRRTENAVTADAIFMICFI